MKWALDQISPDVLLAAVQAVEAVKDLPWKKRKAIAQALLLIDCPGDEKC
jgi:hypothetical protein